MHCVQYMCAVNCAVCMCGVYVQYVCAVSVCVCVLCEMCVHCEAEGVKLDTKTLL